MLQHTDSICSPVGTDKRNHPDSHWQNKVRGKEEGERERYQRCIASDLAMMLLKHPPQSVADSWRSEQNQGVNAEHSSNDGGAAAKKIQETEQKSWERRGRRNDRRLVNVRSCVTTIMRLSDMSTYVWHENMRQKKKWQRTDRTGTEKRD